MTIRSILFTIAIFIFGCNNDGKFNSNRKENSNTDIHEEVNWDKRIISNNTNQLNEKYYTSCDHYNLDSLIVFPKHKQCKQNTYSILNRKSVFNNIAIQHNDGTKLPPLCNLNSEFSVNIQDSQLVLTYSRPIMSNSQSRKNNNELTLNLILRNSLGGNKYIFEYDQLTSLFLDFDNCIYLCIKNEYYTPNRKCPSKITNIYFLDHELLPIYSIKDDITFGLSISKYYYDDTYDELYSKKISIDTCFLKLTELNYTDFKTFQDLFSSNRYSIKDTLVEFHLSSYFKRAPLWLEY